MQGGNITPVSYTHLDVYKRQTDWDLKLVSDGYYDDLIIEYFKKLSSDNRANTELFVRLAHEMEMRPSYKSGWYSWQTDDAHAYVNEMCIRDRSGGAE